jgi:hypothetical protein
LPIICVLISFLAPSELSLYVADLRLPPHRIALLAFFPMAAWRLFFSGTCRVRFFDILFLLYNAWTFIVYAQHGTNGGVAYGGSLALEGMGAYTIARAYVRDIETFHSTLRMFVVTVLVAGLIALPETLFGQHFVHSFLKPIFGGDIYPLETRWGLTRAAATFDHPIHLGTYCAGLVALVWYSERRAQERYGKMAIMGVATFTALSSAPLLCAALQVGLAVLERVTRQVKNRAMIAGIALAGLYIGISLFATRSPIAILATGLTIDSWTGYYRLHIWENGIKNVLAHPLFGIGLADWERPWWMISGTVDSLWLVTAMRSGLPSVILMGLSVVFLAFAVSKATWNRSDPQRARIATGWLISMFAWVLVGFTVHYWNVLYTVFFFFLGLGGWLADAKRVRRRARRPAIGLGALQHGVAAPIPANALR